MNARTNNRILSQDPVNVRRRDRAKLARDIKEENEYFAECDREENEEYENTVDELYGKGN